MNDSMAELPVLLSSSDPTVRTRSIALLSSVFMTDPMTIINSFDQYYDFFHNVLEERYNDSITYFSLNKILCKSICKIKCNFPSPNAPIKLLQYISECVTCSVTEGHTNAFVSDMYNKSIMISSVSVLFQSIATLDNGYIPSILKILYESDKEQTLIDHLETEQNKQKFIQYIKANPKTTINDAFRCILSLSTKISDFAAEIVNRASENDYEILRMLAPYSASVRNHPNFETNRNLKALYQKLSIETNNDNYITKLNPTPFAPLARAIFAQKTFENVNVSDTKKFLKEQQLPAPPPPSNIGQNSLSALLDFHGISQDKPEKKLVSPAAIEKPQQQLKYLEISAQKKGGGLGKTWQRRWFQFYPSNKCLVWKQSKTAESVKGILLLDHNVKVDKNDSNSTLYLKLKEKTHSIQFDKKEDFDEWCKTLQACASSESIPSK